MFCGYIQFETTRILTMDQDQLTWQDNIFKAIVRGDELSSIEPLLREGDINFKNGDEFSPLLHACKCDRPDVAQILIEMGADVNTTDDLRETALYRAAQKGWLEVAKSLVENGADLNFTGPFGQTPLFAACAFNKLEVLQFLLDSGADPNIQTLWHASALHMATRTGRPPVMEMLLRGGADVNLPCSKGIPPLHQTRNPVIAEILIRAGADVNNINLYNGRTPFSKFVRSEPGIHFLEVCLEHGAYMHLSDYEFMLSKPEMERDFLQNSRLCALAIANRFNYKDLPHLYKLEGKMAKSLPNFKKLKIACTSSSFEEIEKTVIKDIAANGHCNVPKMKPIVLSMLCIKPLIAFYSYRPYTRKEKIPQMVLRSSMKKEEVPKMVLRSATKRVGAPVASSKKSRRR